DQHHKYFADSREIYVKLIFSRESDVILGGQVFGSKYVAEILNLIGLCVQKSMTISELITIQIGTHPVLTSSPAEYPIIIAAVDAMKNQLSLNKMIFCDFNNEVYDNLDCHDERNKLNDSGSIHKVEQELEIFNRQ
ncbi:MAG: hypothetical protein QW076_05645, partial [Candidatus Anstonellales archaeon]